MGKKYLFTPGPTEVPPSVLAACAEPIIHHRTPEFEQIFAEVNEGLQYVFETSNPVLTFAASGTGAMESAVANLLSAGDEALCVQGGKFGERWTELCNAYGVKATPLDVEWGKAVEPSLIEKQLKDNPALKAVFVTLSETSTGVRSDLEAIGKIVAKTPAALVVDAVSGLGATRCRTDAWHLDVVVAGSQKALMLPPGLAMVSVSDKAWALVEKSTLPKYYFDWKKAKSNLDKKTTPFTPAVSLIVALRESLRLIREETLDAALARQARMAEACRAGLEAIGIELYSQSPVEGVTVGKVPEGIKGGDFVKRLWSDFGIKVAGGQAQLKGKIFRIATMGSLDCLDIPLVISAVEMTLHRMGYPVELGKGVAAAEKVLAQPVQ